MQTYQIQSRDKYFSTKIISQKKPKVRYDANRDMYIFNIHINSELPIQCFLSKEYIYPSYWIKTVINELKVDSNIFDFFTPEIGIIKEYPYIDVVTQYQFAQNNQKAIMFHIISVDLIDNSLLCIHDNSIPKKNFIQYISFLLENLNIHQKRVSQQKSFQKIYIIKNAESQNIGYLLQAQREFGNYRISEENINEIWLDANKNDIRQISFSDIIYSNLKGEIQESIHNHYQNAKLIYNKNLKKVKENTYTIIDKTEVLHTDNKKKRKKRKQKDANTFYTEIPLVDTFQEQKLIAIWINQYSKQNDIKIVKYLPKYSEDLTFLKIKYKKETKKSMKNKDNKEYEFYIGNTIYGKLSIDTNNKIQKISIQKPTKQTRTYRLVVDK